MKQEKYIINGKTFYVKRTYTVSESTLFQRIKVYLDRAFEEQIKQERYKKGE